MSKVLLVTSSPRGEESVSSKFAIELAEKLKAQSAGGKITHLDLGVSPIPHIDSVTVSAIRKPAEERNAEEAAAAGYSDARVAELLDADVIVLASGVINFNISSSLKSWIDNIARAGQTFKYTENGPVGLVSGKKAFVVLASGGIYSEGPAASLNHSAPYLKNVLGFIGVSDVEVLYIEGLAYGPEAAEKAIAAASAKVEELAKAA